MSAAFTTGVAASSPGETAATRPYIGGQAVIEGVMMRSPGSISIVCRKRSGELVVHERPMPPSSKGPRSWPFVRGVMTVVESVRLGSRALRWSADIFEQDMEDGDEGEDGKSKEATAKASAISSAFTALAHGVVALVAQDGSAAAPGPAEDSDPKKPAGVLAWLPLVFAVGLFVALPQLGAEGVNKLFGLNLEVTSPGFQAITGGAKLLIVVGYLLLIRQIAEIRRVFQYHGAEHKTISTYESRQELLVENARQMTTLHPRCGTTFLVMVALVSIVVFTVIGAFLPVLPGGRVTQSIGFFFMKLPFLPVVASVTFEIQRIFARYCTTGPLRALLWPGFVVQKITTAEPDDEQLEVALASLRATLWREEAALAPTVPDRTFPDYEKLVADPGYA